jgi:hypothetical protein
MARKVPTSRLIVLGDASSPKRLLVAAHVLRLNVGNKALLKVWAKMLEIVALDALGRDGESKAFEN